VPLEGYFTLKTFVKVETSTKPWESTLPQLTLGDTLHKLVKESVPRDILVKLQNVFCGPVIRAALRGRIDPYLPKTFGGLGYLPADMSAKPNVHGQKVVHYLHNHPQVISSPNAKMYPKGSLCRYTQEALATALKPLRYGFEGATSMILTDDAFTSWWLEITMYHAAARLQYAPPKFLRYLKELHKCNSRLARNVKASRVFIRRNYAQCYDLESRFGIVKATHDIICSATPEQYSKQFEESLKFDINKEIVDRLNSDLLLDLRTGKPYTR
jgi:hypothetical protein